MYKADGTFPRKGFGKRKETEILQCHWAKQRHRYWQTNIWSMCVIPISLSSKLWWVESVLGHVKLWGASFTAICCEPWSPETSKWTEIRSQKRASSSLAPLPGQWPHKVERRGCLWIHLLFARLPGDRWRVSFSGDWWPGPATSEWGPSYEHHEHQTGARTENLCSN